MANAAITDYTGPRYKENIYKTVSEPKTQTLQRRWGRKILSARGPASYGNCTHEISTIWLEE